MNCCGVMTSEGKYKWRLVCHKDLQRVKSSDVFRRFLGDASQVSGVDSACSKAARRYVYQYRMGAFT